MAIVTADAVFDALSSAGVLDPKDRVTRVVIDLKAGDLPVIHVEMWGDEKLVCVARTLDGVEIRRE